MAPSAKAASNVRSRSTVQESGRGSELSSIRRSQMFLRERYGPKGKVSNDWIESNPLAIHLPMQVTENVIRDFGDLRLRRRRADKVRQVTTQMVTTSASREYNAAHDGSHSLRL